MQVGDPKKTAILAVVAIAALAFCFKQLTGGGDQPRALRQAPDAAAAGGTSAPTGTLVAMNLDPLMVDAFSHPKLAPHGVDTPPGPNSAPSAPVITDPGFKPGEQVVLPPIGQGPQIDKTRPDTWPVPVDPRTSGQTVQVEKLTQVGLKAVVKVDQRIAYLAIDGGEARGFKAGDQIKNDIHVVFVNDDSVIVKSRKTTVTLKVGQQGDL